MQTEDRRFRRIGSKRLFQDIAPKTLPPARLNWNHAE
jgi:hypothetical protein